MPDLLLRICLLVDQSTITFILITGYGGEAPQSPATSDRGIHLVQILHELALSSILLAEVPKNPALASASFLLARLAQSFRPHCHQALGCRILLIKLVRTTQGLSVMSLPTELVLHLVVERDDQSSHFWGQTALSTLVYCFERGHCCQTLSYDITILFQLLLCLMLSLELLKHLLLIFSSDWLHQAHNA